LDPIGQHPSLTLTNATCIIIVTPSCYPLNRLVSNDPSSKHVSIYACTTADPGGRSSKGSASDAHGNWWETLEGDGRNHVYYPTEAPIATLPFSGYTIRLLVALFVPSCVMLWLDTHHPTHLC
jgi:hypothetical protein